MKFCTTVGLSLLLLAILAGCGSQTGIPLAPGDGPGISSDTNRDASFAYTNYFVDTVNSFSNSRWTVSNDTGHTFWKLGNAAVSDGVAWNLGRNYWNHENDSLTSKLFTIPAHRAGNRFAFYTRWNIAENDFGYVQYRYDGGDWVTLATFTGESNDNYPAFNKYTFNLPDTGANDTQANVRFLFTSDGSGTAWGLAVDSVSVFQRKLSMPLNLQASQGTAGKIVLNWDRPTDLLHEDRTEIWRSDAEFGEYVYLDWVGYPAHDYTDTSVVAGDTYWYKIRCTKLGYPPSGYTAAVSGYANP